MTISCGAEVSSGTDLTGHLRSYNVVLINDT